MRAGELHHVITIEQQTGSTGDGYGNTHQTWTALASNVRASITPLTGREVFAGEKVTTLTTHQIQLRYWPGITSKMRVGFGTRIFNIVSLMNEEERNISLMLLVQEQF